MVYMTLTLEALEVHLEVPLQSQSLIHSGLFPTPKALIKGVLYVTIIYLADYKQDYAK